MSTYEARIRETATGIYAMVVQVDRDGQEQVDPTYRGRHFATRKAAERSTSRHIAQGVAP